jgi:CBS domain-containing protein
MTRRVGDLMDVGAVALVEDATVKDVARSMSEFRVSALPVIDVHRHVVGVVSEADLILKDEGSFGEPWLLERRARRDARRKMRATTAGELMTAPATVIGPEADVADLARSMREQRLKCVPVCDPDGRLLGVISRLDLVREFLRDDSEIADEVRRILRVEMSLGDLRCDVNDGVVTLEGLVEHRSQVPGILERIRGVAGSIDVVGRLNWMEDDELPILRPAPWIAV